MSNLRLLLNNSISKATLSCLPSPVATLPVDNIKNIERSEVLRTSGTSITISGTLSKITAVNHLALARYTLSNTATVQLILKQTDTVIYDSTALNVATLIPLKNWRVGVDAFGAAYEVPGIAKTFTHQFNPVYANNFELVITDTDNPDGWFDIWFSMLGLSIELPKNFDWGASLEWVDTTTHEDADDGTLRSNIGSVRRLFTLDLNLLDNTTRARVETDFIQSGKEQPILVSGYPDAADLHMDKVTSFVAKRDVNAKFTHNRYNNNQQNLLFLEC